MPSFAALADDTRVEILEALGRRPRSVSELVELFPISQPAVSRHLRILRDAGLVASVTDGQRRIYRLDPRGLREISEWTEKRLDALGGHLDVMAARRRKG